MVPWSTVLIPDDQPGVNLMYIMWTLFLLKLWNILIYTCEINIAMLIMKHSMLIFWTLNLIVENILCDNFQLNKFHDKKRSRALYLYLWKKSTHASINIPTHFYQVIYRNLLLVEHPLEYVAYHIPFQFIILFSVIILLLLLFLFMWWWLLFI